MTAAEIARWRRHVVRVAQGNLGFGEVEGDNRGPLLRAIGAPDGAHWCAYLGSYIARRAAQYAEVVLPFKGSGNAKKLGHAIATCSHGRILVMPGDPPEQLHLIKRGDFVILHRGPRDTEDGPGHVRVVEAEVRADGRVPQIHGNSGRYPAVVSRIARNPLKERLVYVVGLR